MKTVIMAGGMGTRIASVRSDVPKPMIEICGKPILQYQIENLKSCGLTDITLVIGHLGDVIKKYFGDGSKFGVSIKYFNETTPLGTAGALFKMLSPSAECETVLDDDFLLLCGDVIFDIDFNRFIKFHKEKKAWASLMSHPNGHPYDSSLLVTEVLPPAIEGELPQDTKKVTRWLAKEDERIFYKNRVNAGLEILSPEILKAVLKAKAEGTWKPKHADNPDKIDLDRDVLKFNIPSGKIFAYDTPEYIKDMGTPDRYYETEGDIKSGKVHARNLSSKQKAVFLDRDGTINKDVGFCRTIDDLEVLDNAKEAIKKINKSGYLAIVITNQPVIARGEVSFEKLYEMHDKMETQLGKEGAFVDGIYYCPHHPDKGFDGERAAYKKNCCCRKPKSGLFEMAAQDFNIDLSQSYMIGDSHRDMEAGKNAGCRDCILVDESNTILDAVNKILG